MEGTKISQEAIQKALEVLGLTESTDDNSSADETAKAELKKAEEAKAADDLKKAEESDKLKADYQEYISKAKEFEDKAKELGVDLVKADGGAQSVDLGENSNANGGTVTTQTVSKASADNDLIKALDEKVSSVATLYKASQEENQDLKKSLDEATKLYKAISERIGIVEKQPLERKSVTTDRFVERFDKGGDGSAEGGKVLSLSDSKQRAELADIMFEAAIENGKVTDKEFAKAIEYVEISKSLGSDSNFAKRIQNRLKSEHKITIVK